MPASQNFIAMCLELCTDYEGLAALFYLACNCLTHMNLMRLHDSGAVSQPHALQAADCKESLILFGP